MDRPPGFAGALRRLFEEARTRLIQADSRNRLIHTPRDAKRSKSLKLTGISSDRAFETLVRNKGSLSFLPIPEEGKPVREDGDARSEKALKTELTSEALQKRLIGLYRDAKTLEEEQGVNILYLAIGFLRWFESDSSEIAREAPLILIPVALTRSSVRSAFKLSVRDDELTVNLPLLERLKEFGISLPTIPEDETWTPSEYFDEVRAEIGSQKRWSIDDEGMLLAFFSFSKLLMFRDLDSANWPNEALINHSILKALLADGFPSEEPLFPDEEQLDERLDLPSLIHVVDADASQAVAIETIRKGRNLVIQGPPGTGKSQTITNIIAAAVHDRKTVLFVAEKMAALEVVHRRLVKAGLRDVCLELHSRKANKRAVIEEIDRTRRSAKVKSVGDDGSKRLRGLVEFLNENSSKLHNPVTPSGVTPFRALAEQVRWASKGYSAPQIAVPDLSEWTDDKTRTVVVCLQKLLEVSSKTGSKYQHPWRGVTAITLQPADLMRLRAELTRFEAVCAVVEGILKQTSEAFGFSRDCSIAEFPEIVRLIRQISDQPGVRTEVLKDVAGVPDLQRLARTMVFGKKLREAVATIAGSFSESAWNTSLVEIRAGLATGQNSWTSRLRSPYKKASKQLAGLLSVSLPKDVGARLGLVDHFMRAQELRTEIENEDGYFREALGATWKGPLTDFDSIEKALTWLLSLAQNRLEPSLPKCAASFGNLATIIPKVAGAGEQFVSAADKISKTVGLDIDAAFGVEKLALVPIQKFIDRARSWLTDFDRISEWFDLARADRIVREEGGGLIADELALGILDPKLAIGELQYARGEAIWKAAIARDATLAEVDGATRSDFVKEFNELERERFGLVANEIQRRHQMFLPKGGIGEMGVILGEIGKTRGHLPIRKLVERTGKTLQTLKPVFMMSPISVAQFLPPGKIDFDLLVIDEASQVRPEDALGVIGRVKQVVVVGDKKQLPPTSFFDRVVDDDENDDDVEEANVTPLGGAAKATELESILSICEARGMSRHMLTWHYRSRHPSLIEVSNDEFYENKLFLPPSPSVSRANIGLVARRVDGSYDRGGKRTNKIEAQAVVKAILDHAKNNADLSLGVVTFSMGQRDLLENLLEMKRREDSDLDGFMSKTSPEEFFVKNLENVQGDERDCIFISVGYGPRTAGAGLESMNFGPVSTDGGERRLNVLFTRARSRCEVFVSFSSGDIDLARTKMPGPRILKRFLRFAETGNLDLPIVTGGTADSPFEEAVADYIGKLGYAVDLQVGSVGFKIDLAVKNPNRVGEYLLAVECDGATYHSARWARERDRLRQQVLEDQGWFFHRIWSTDWFRNPERAKSRLVEAIETAKIRAT